MGEVLPYLEVYKSQQEDVQKIQMPDVVGLKLKESKEMLEGFEIEVQTENYSNESIIIKQIPEAGIEISNSGKVLLYLE